MASPAKALYMLGGAIFIAALVFIGIYFSYHNTRHFEESECTVIEHQTLYTTECNCDDKTNCFNGYAPCVRIFVAFMDIDSENRTAMLYLSDVSYFHDKQCTYPSCDVQIRAEEHFEVIFDDDFLEFLDTYTQIGKTFNCFYNPEEDEAIITRNVTKMRALWALTAFIFYVVFEVIYCLYKLYKD